MDGSPPAPPRGPGYAWVPRHTYIPLMDVFAVLGRSYAPHPGAVSTYTVLGDTLGCNPGTTATLHGAPFRLGHGGQNVQTQWVPYYH